jgi:His-Xaa-Ser system protein HxsD
MEILISKEFYNEKALKDCVYWYSNELVINIVDKENNHLVVVSCEELNDGFKKEFLQKLNDFNLREAISQRTAEIKNLMIAKAFYPDLVELGPVGEFRDPIEMDKEDEAEL